MLTLTIDNYSNWRKTARTCLQKKIPPEHTHWLLQTAGNSLQQQASLLDSGQDIANLPTLCDTPHVPGAFFDIAKLAFAFRDTAQLHELYALAWKLSFENKRLLDQLNDPLVKSLQQKKKRVSRDMHKMKAFVRFNQVKTDENSHDEYYVAWFEPEHRILELIASFFTRRFYNIHWSILTPDGSLHWDTHTLQHSHQVCHAPRTQDDMEDMWLEYYQSIFNPARLKLKAMQAEMPKKYWKNLPEAKLIKQLTQSAQIRAEKMIEKSPDPEENSITQSKHLSCVREALSKRE